MTHEARFSESVLKIDVETLLSHGIHIPYHWNIVRVLIPAYDLLNTNFKSTSTFFTI